MRYFIISGIKNAGKTTCVCNLYSYLISKGYRDVVPPIKNNDIISLLSNQQQFVLINSASDNEQERMALESFINTHNLFKDEQYSNLVIITALREWATGKYNCKIRKAYENTLGLNARSSANLVDITIGIDTNNMHQNQKSAYFYFITDMARKMISSPPFYL